ncbi:unnamed protein product [Peronospora destructor]|uniref:Uncharacterized protein n=1 Tax=Peronospora destructor TaxID=86335 RepID=A0AAV0U885_9STRA|nr:unnamed protein product [Peronospora destructor]
MAPTGREDSGAASSTGPKSSVPCSYCVGLSVYTKDMWRKRETPECKGIQMDFSTSRERLQELRERAACPRKNDFTFMGFGLSRDADELMKQIEEHKRIKRELQKKTGNKGDLQNGDDTGDDDDENLVQDEEDDGFCGFEDGKTTDGGHALVENEVVRGLKTPRGLAVVPASITMAEVRDRAVEKAKYSVNAMYEFWERRLDGFSERYVDSCRRLTEQMEKQAKSTPHNVMWLVHRIEKYIARKDDGEE